MARYRAEIRGTSFHTVDGVTKAAKKNVRYEFSAENDAVAMTEAKRRSTSLEMRVKHRVTDLNPKITLLKLVGRA